MEKYHFSSPNLSFERIKNRLLAHLHVLSFLTILYNYYYFLLDLYNNWYAMFNLTQNTNITCLKDSNLFYLVLYVTTKLPSIRSTQLRKYILYILHRWSSSHIISRCKTLLVNIKFLSVHHNSAHQKLIFFWKHTPNMSYQQSQ